jgi:glycosyltransferase involved in cell wall biosynthesis
MSLPKVVHVTSYYPPHLGGQEVVVQALAAQLADRGCDVEVVTSDVGGRPGRTKEEHVRVMRLRSLDVAHTAVMWYLPIYMLRWIRRDAIVHVHVGQAFTADVVWLLSKFLRFRYVLQLHCDPLPSGRAGGLLPLYKRMLLPRYIRDASAVVVLNSQHARLVEERYSRRRGALVMLNGVDDRFFEVVREPSSAERLDVLFVGQLTPNKNVGALMQAAGHLGDAVALHIVGDGESRAELQAMASEQGLSNVTFYGRRDRSEVAELYSRCDLFVLPSLYEAQPMVILEAMASRIAVMTTEAVGSALNIADSAVIVKPTVDGMIRGIETYITMPPSLRKRMVSSAFDRAQLHRWESVISSYCELYTHVAHR